MENRAVTRPLREVVRHLTHARWSESAGETPVRGVAADSRLVEAGDLFVAIPGISDDGREYVPDAVARGAVAVVTNGAMSSASVPVVSVPDPRRAVAELAGAWHGWEDGALPLVGVTGTFGKTSILAMLDSIMARAGGSLGVIGSEALGVRLRGRQVAESTLTTPDPLVLHRHLASMRSAGAEAVALEVTSQALEQKRVHGLLFDLGIFTTLSALEHTEYHATFRDYVEAKQRFFDHLRPDAPLLYGCDNLALQRLVEEHGVNAIGCGTSRRSEVMAREESLPAAGTRLRLDVRVPLPRLAGGSIGPLDMELELRLLGAPAVLNAALAASAALCLGADPEAIRTALADLPVPFRRMEIIHRGEFTVMDDTAGHPDSVSATLEVILGMRPRAVHVVFGVRGQRGEAVNEADGAALAMWAPRLPLETLIVTASADAADEPNRVAPEEAAAFTGALDREGVAYRFVEGLEDAVAAAVDRVGPGDLLLLIGAQGMDPARDFLRDHLPLAPRPE